MHTGLSNSYSYSRDPALQQTLSRFYVMLCSFKCVSMPLLIVDFSLANLSDSYSLAWEIKGLSGRRVCQERGPEV